MKMNFYLSILAILLATLNADAQQKKLLQNAIKVASLVPATGSGCGLNTRPCAVTNKGTDRTITVKVEESLYVNNVVHKKIIVLDKVAPNENRYIGCSGCVQQGLYEKCLGYKILLAYYDEADSTRVRALFAEKQETALK